MTKRIVFLLAVLIASFSYAQTSKTGDEIVGMWQTGNAKAKVNITKSGSFYYGRIAWIKEPMDKNGKPKVDQKNPDASKRGTPIIGLRLLSGFEYKGDDLWKDGTIYDPESGKTYQCKIEMADINTLNIRGYIGISAIGRTDVWKRVR